MSCTFFSGIGAALFVAVGKKFGAQYKETFFDTCEIASTRILNLYTHPRGENGAYVSYTIDTPAS